MERLRGVTRALAATEYRLVLFDIERPEQRDDAFRMVAGRADGVLSISLVPTDEELARFRAAGVPVVVVDRDDGRVPSVSIDDVAGGRMAAEHLIGLGHRRIAFLGDDEDTQFGFASSARRREGCALALTAANLPVRPELIRRGPHGRDQAAAMTRELLAGDEPPTAVFAASDLQALGVLEAAQAVGLEVPRDLSIVGFDDIEVAGYAGLTTVAQPLEESGRRGAELLLEALGGAAGSGHRLPLELVVRGSTGPPRVHGTPQAGVETQATVA
jgi:DNA-binding LacI/PurR family transcriptional regulator